MSESNASAVSTATITPSDFFASVFPTFDGRVSLSKDKADPRSDPDATRDFDLSDVDGINAFVLEAERSGHDVIALPGTTVYGPAVFAIWFPPGAEITDRMRSIGTVLTPTDPDPTVAAQLRSVLVLSVDGPKEKVDTLYEVMRAEYPGLCEEVPLPGRSWSLEAGSQVRRCTVGQVLAAMLEGSEDKAGLSSDEVILSIDGTVGSLDDDPSEIINDAEIYGQISDDIWNKKLFVSTAKRREDKFFKVSQELRFSDILISNLTKIRVGPKDGNCLVPGVLVDGRRLNQAVTKLYMMGLDVDSGASMQDTMRKLQERGLFFVAYTTHSHGTASIEIKRDRFQKWAATNGYETDATVETVKLFLTAEGKYTADVIASVDSIQTSHETSGIQLIVSTRPIDKFRLLFVLEEPYVIAEQPRTQQEVIRAWGNMILGMGASLGISVDRAARDCSRLFYLASKPKGSKNARVVVSAGKALDWKTITPVVVTGTVSADPFDQAASIMGGHIRGLNMTPQKGLSLQKWAGEKAHGFVISQVFKDHCDDRLKEETAPGKYTCECPFDDEHSNAGDPDDKGCFIQDAGLDAETFTFRCSHDSCAGRDRLAMLEKAMNDGWFTDDVISDPAYDISTADEGQDEEESEAGKATTADIARAMDLANKAKVGMPSDQITAILKMLLPMGPLDREQIIKLLAMKIKISAAQLSSLFKAIELKASPVVQDTPYDAPKTAKEIKKRFKSLHNEKRPIVLVNEDHGVATLRHLLHELDRANRGDRAAGLDPAHTLFDFGGNRVRIGKDKWSGKRRIDELSRDVIGNVSNELLYLVKLTDSNAQTEAFLPEQFAKQAVVDPGLQLLPLERFVKHPLFTKAGKILTKSGYDPDTRCYIDLGLELEIDSNVPVKWEDVTKAVTALKDTFGDFRWVATSDDDKATGAGSWASFCALLIAPLIREAWEGNMPLFGIDKTDAGSGGTLLAECAHIIWTGERPALDNWPKGAYSDEEVGKMIISILMAGRGAIIFDNVHGVIAGSIIPKITTGGVSGRLLGGNKMFEGRVRYPVVFVGNNLSWSDENVRRVLPIKIKPNVVKRDAAGNKIFNIKGDLAEHLIKNRATILTHLINIVRWWFQENQPVTARAVESFEEFVSTMGGILQAAGIDGWLEGHKAFLAETKNDQADEIGILEALAGKFGLDADFTAKQAIPILFAKDEDGPAWAPYEPLFDYLRHCVKSGSVTGTTLGNNGLKYLAKGQERIIQHGGKPVTVSLKKRRGNGKNGWIVATVKSK